MSLVQELRRTTSAPTDAYKVDEEAYWSDDQLTDILEENSKTMLNERIALVREPDGDTIVGEILEVTGVIDPENPGVVKNSAGTEVDFEIDSSGEITFPEAQLVHDQLVWTGKVYNLQEAASSVLTAWANAMATAYDIKMDGQELSRSQMSKALADRAQEMSGGDEGGGIQSVGTFTDDRYPTRRLRGFRNR